MADLNPYLSLLHTRIVRLVISW